MDPILKDIINEFAPFYKATKTIEHEKWEFSQMFGEEDEGKDVYNDVDVQDSI